MILLVDSLQKSCKLHWPYVIFGLFLGDMLAYVLHLFDLYYRYFRCYFAPVDYSVNACGWRYLLVLHVYFIPKLSKISNEQANARAVMTGRVTDAYTNIQTVKLFAHAGRESQYAKSSMKEFMVTVYKQMRLGCKIQHHVRIC